jgi:hypothetical protein
MAYGRLDVLFPDGNFRSFPLMNPTESLGRSPGNTIRLDVETISRYHFSIIHKDNQITLADMDSQNGTYVDGIKVPNGESVQLRGGEEILIGELRLIFHIMDEMPTQPMTAFDETTEIIQTDAPFKLSVQPPPIAIPPGAHASAELSIVNTTDEKGFYTITVEGIPRNWVRLDRPKVLLEPNDSTQVVINVRPVRHPETRPGDYPITIHVKEESHAETPARVNTRIHILSYGGFGMALEREEIDARETFRLHLHNQGNADLPLSIGGSQRTSDVEVQIKGNSHVNLGPGQRKVVEGTARLRNRKLLGQPQTSPFDITVRSGEANQFLAVVGGKVTQHAMLPSWLPIVGGVALIGVIGFITLITRILSVPAPTLTTLSVEPLSIARGGAFQVEWEVSDVEDLQLFIDETPIAALTPDALGYTLDTTFLSENPVIELRASNGRREAEPIQQRVQVYEPMQLISFTANPSQLVRNVVTTLSLDWEVENAVFVRLNGLEVFASGSVDPAFEYEAIDSLDPSVTGLSQSNLTVELYAEDELGNIFTDTIVIETVPALCTTQDAPVLLLDGPNPLNQQISTVPPNTTITVIGRDISGAWIAVELDGGLIGWGALDQLTCAENFLPSELQQIIDVTPPPFSTETPAPLPTATLLPTNTAIAPTNTPGPVITQETNSDTSRRPTATPAN